MPNLVKVLSIDGGGIRGIIPAMVLAEIERRTGRPIATLFHLIAGTSTGGILALGLTKPNARGEPEHTAKKLIGLYEKEGQRIFSRSVWRKMRAMDNLVEEKYSADELQEVLDSYFGEARLKDALAEVFITSYEIERRAPFFFRSTRAKRDPTNYDFFMKQAARATAAAPTYFEPLKLEASAPSDYYALIDGGVYANNPAMCAYVEAKTLYPQANDFLVVSLGTGELTRPLPYEDARGWGLAGWAQPMLSVMFDGISDTVDYQLRQLLCRGRGGCDRYYRFQARLDESNDDMDNASRKNIRALKLLAEDLLRRESQGLDALCGLLAR